MRNQFCHGIVFFLILAAAALAAAPSVEDLIRDLRTGTPQQQVAGADQLARMGAAAKPAIPALLDAMGSTSPWVGLAMMDALAELHLVSLPVLTEMFTDADTAKRLQIIRAFWSMGARAKDVRPLMVKLLHDENAEVRRRAQMTLAKIDAELAEATVAAPLRAAELWAVRIGAAYPEYGALSTPSIVGDALYVLSTDANLFNLETATAAIRWQHNLTNEFAGKMMSAWKYSESPLVDGDRVIVTPGGKDAMMVAFHKNTGALLWKCAIPALGERGSDGAAYSSAIATTPAARCLKSNALATSGRPSRRTFSRPRRSKTITAALFS